MNALYRSGSSSRSTLRPCARMFLAACASRSAMRPQQWGQQSTECAPTPWFTCPQLDNRQQTTDNRQQNRQQTTDSRRHTLTLCKSHGLASDSKPLRRDRQAREPACSSRLSCIPLRAVSSNPHVVANLSAAEALFSATFGGAPGTFRLQHLAMWSLLAILGVPYNRNAFCIRMCVGNNTIVSCNQTLLLRLPGV